MIGALSLCFPVMALVRKQPVILVPVGLVVLGVLLLVLGLRLGERALPRLIDASAVLAAFYGYFEASGAQRTLEAFHATFATMGLITIASAGIFWQLAPDIERDAGPHRPVEAGGAQP